MKNRALTWFGALTVSLAGCATTAGRKAIAQG